MKQQLKQHIISRFGKEPPHLDKVLAAFEANEPKRKHYLLMEGEVCNKIYFVVKGSLQIEAVDENGVGSILGFVFENHWYTVMESFQQRSPSKESIVTAEASQVLELSKNKFDQLKAEIPEFSIVYGQVLEEHNAQFMQRINTLMTLDATERVKWFLDKHPEMITRLNSNIIANYLKIRPETFSRIKSKIFNS